MIDLSNLNGTPDFRRLWKAGQRRIYAKVTEGQTFVDATYVTRRALALQAGFKVGGYHFGRPGHSDPKGEAQHFVRHLGPLIPGKSLRPCLDFEIGDTSAEWALTFMSEVKRLTGVQPIIYSYADFLARSRFARAPGALWLASYGRNDGLEHPFSIPRPWTKIVAHQFSSRARIVGAQGFVDISHVFNGRALDVTPRRWPLLFWRHLEPPRG